MSTAPEIRVYDYVNHGYDQVRALVTENARAVFQAATTAAASRARSVASQLRVDLGVVGIEAEINIHVRKIVENYSEPVAERVTRLHLEWQAATMPALFPVMNGELAIYPLTATETQLDFSGEYKPPLGALGRTVDAIAGRRVAEATVHSFVSDVAAYLRRAIA